MIYDTHTNLPARGPISTNLPARSPALRTCPLVVLLYRHARSPTHVIHQLRTSSHATSLKCEQGTYEPTSLVSPHESNWIWTSSLISSRVHHHPWTYPLMTKHLLIQVCINAYKQHTQKTKPATISLGLKHNIVLFSLRLVAFAQVTRPISLNLGSFA